ncbi:hypothetical protein GT360_18380 [Vibrio astriarenae]|uniref:Uncharacterized protein n=1 Tax=Vibrio astriarenae TaxID=1481923 RepID=A0A7Z2T6W7_9VIBR|nr:hypothetical protein [Vibrio astriarenae]QIA65503.1 hypothetical protein GT360_18380 [Vibrio astriarenae]
MQLANLFTRQSLAANMIVFCVLLGVILYVEASNAHIAAKNAEFENYLATQIQSCALKAQANAPQPRFMMNFLSGEVMEYRTPKENEFIDFLYQQCLENLYLLK